MVYLRLIKNKIKKWMNATSSKDHPLQYNGNNWLRIGFKTIVKVHADNLPLLAAGIAFYFLLALFPMLAALLSLYGLFVDDATLAQHMEQLALTIPADSRYIIEEQITSLSAKDDASLSTSFMAGLAFTIYSAGKGAVALITACNITYLESNNRNFVTAVLFRLGLTLTMLVTIVLFLSIIITLPTVLDALDASEKSGIVINITTWFILFVVSTALLSTLYKFAPHRHAAKWRWVTPGAIVASLLWIGGSLAFNIYVSQYASYTDTYGSVGGIIVLLLWFYMTAFIVLLGSEINAASELHTSNDTTTGPDRPFGERGAYVADNKS